MNLLLDMGNSRLKWALNHHDQLLMGNPLYNAQINRQMLLETWANLGRPRAIGIAWVSQSELLSTVKSVAKTLWQDVKIYDIKAQAKAFNVHNAYLNAEKLGVDRWLALVAARRHHSGHCCIVDCGTAITLDLLDSEGSHLGGFICPGLTLMKQSLAAGTGSLPFSVESFDMRPANCTEAAIYAGTLAAAIGLIEQVVKRQPIDCNLILTGGDAELIGQHLKLPVTIETNLVLRGLAIVMDSL
ncbi:MAG: type III pantothenate kinase [Methylovulum sp.]|nr:type III pantothenate kinase [Methylovulum sp.]MCF7999363.1 type III pantothenate kinase [Methylovulum sp.]